MSSEKPYDTIIVGASIAGLYTGMKLAQAGKSVCLIDRRKEIGSPVRCGEATGNRIELERFLSIDESWIARDIKGIIIHYNNTVFKHRQDDFLIMLHRDKFEKSMAKEAQKAGAHILLDTPVGGLLKIEDSFCGVSTENQGEIRGAQIIGADGVESKIGRWAGIIPPLSLKDSFSGLQYTVSTDHFNDHFLYLFAGSTIIPKGYIWAFPKSPKTISVGAGLYGGISSQNEVKRYLEIFISKRLNTNTYENLITGCVPLSICPKLLGSNNVLIIGDAARQVNPLSAGGIMNTLEAADLAVSTILKRKSNTAKINHDYSRKWSSTQRRQQKVFYVFKEIFLESRDEDIEEAIKKVTANVKSVDRSKPFTLSFFTQIRLFLLFLPKVLARWRILLS